jgi:tetratricopeptide (TPR) repeat protein
MARFNLAQAAEWTGDYRRAITLSEDVVATGRRLRLPHLVAWPKWFLGKAWCCVGDYGRAVAELSEAAELCDRIGDRAWTSRLLNTLGWCYGEIGSPGRARAHNERASALAQAIGDPEIVNNSEINLVGNWMALGDVERAERHLEPLRAALASPGDPWMRWRYGLHALDAAGRLALAHRLPEQALAIADEQLEGARRHRVTKIEARALALRGQVLLVLERGAEAEVELAEAVAIADRIAYPRGAWVALRTLIEAKRRAGRSAEVETLVARRGALVDRAARSLADRTLRQELVVAASR